MANENKDLTDLIQHSKKLQAEGQLPPPVQGTMMEQTPIEPIDNFESLDEYAAANPPPDPSLTPAPSAAPENPTAPEPFPSADSNSVGPPEPDLPSAPEPDSFNFPTPEPSSNASSNFSTDSSDGVLDSSLNNSLDASLTPPETPPEEPPALQPEVLAPSPSASNDPPSPVQATADPKSRNSIENIKKFSESVPIGKPAVPAAYPFSLLITGPLLAEEKEKLLDLLSRENMGIREIDLEPQLASGKILIPRMSEYAGILLVQALRGTQADIRFGPSDSIFQSKDDPPENNEGFFDANQNQVIQSADQTHPAEQLPITSEKDLPQIPHFKVIDTITASALLKLQAVEVEASSEYQAMVDALQTEIKYKAYRKGASAIINFKVQLNSLSSPAEYRLLALGTAVQPSKTVLK